MNYPFQDTLVTFYLSHIVMVVLLLFHLLFVVIFHLDGELQVVRARVV